MLMIVAGKTGILRFPLAAGKPYTLKGINIPRYREVTGVGERDRPKAARPRLPCPSPMTGRRKKKKKV